MRIACYQGPEQPDSPAGNLARLEAMAARAKAAGAGLLIAPELFLTGYCIGADNVHRLAEPLDGTSMQAAARIARDLGIGLLFGLPERAGEHVYNTAVLLDAEGRLLASYRKTHLFGSVDREAFSPGTERSAVVAFGELRIGMLICYDVEFPEAVRLLSLRGADLVIVPTALMQPYDVVARILVPARAYENQVYLAYVDRCGTEAEFVYCGLSCVVGPDGADVARAGRSEELILADIDVDGLNRSRLANTHLNDRRPELYGPLSIRDPS